MARARLKVVSETNRAELPPADELELPAEPLQPRECRQHLRERLLKEFPRIAKGFADKAAEGSVQHVKLALELVDPEESGGTAIREKSDVQLLMEELGLE